MIEKSKLSTLADESQKGEYLIARVEKEASADVDDVVHEFEKLADKVGFNVSRVESGNLNGSRNEVVRFFTNTFSKVPKEEACKARLWMMSATCRSDHIIDAEVKIDKSNGHSNQGPYGGE